MPATHLDVSSKHLISDEQLGKKHFEGDDKEIAAHFAIEVLLKHVGGVRRRAREVVMVVRMWRNYGGHGVEPMCSFKEFGAAAHDAAVDVFQFYDGAPGINQSLTRLMRRRSTTCWRRRSTSPSRSRKRTGKAPSSTR